MKILIYASGAIATTAVILLIPEVIHTAEKHQMEHPIESKTRLFQPAARPLFLAIFPLLHPLSGGSLPRAFRTLP